MRWPSSVARVVAAGIMTAVAAAPAPLVSSSAPNAADAPLEPANATRPAARLAPPPVMDCAGTTVMVFGNSIDSELGVVDPATSWPNVLERLLAGRPDIVGIDVVSAAVPGSTIVSPSPWGTAARLRLVTHVPETLGSWTPAALARLIVVIHPSIVELQLSQRGDTDTTIAQRALGGVLQVRDWLARAGVARVIFLPTAPVTAGADFLQGVALNARITLFDRMLADGGLTPPEMRQSALLDPRTGFGNERYYDDFRVPGGIFGTGPDGMHPDPEGHLVLATSVAVQPALEAALHATCRSR